MAKVTVSTGLSTTKDSAQSKNCRMKAKVASHEMRWEIAVAICQMDDLLFAEYGRDIVKCRSELKSVYETGQRPGRGKKGSVSIEIELD